MTAENQDVLATVDNGVGFLTLNRPRAINSLTHSMVTTLHEVLKGWEHDDDVRDVVLFGAGEGVCAPAVTWSRSITARAPMGPRPGGFGAMSTC